MLPVLNIGPFALYTPGLILLLGGWLILQVSGRAARLKQLNGDRLEMIIFITMLAGVIGARLGYALMAWPSYVADPWALLSRDLQAFSPLAGVATAIIIGSVMLWRQRWPLWPTFDALTPGIALAVLTHAIAQLASGDGYGLPAEVPWAINLWGELRHPTQLYAALTALIALVVWRVRYRQSQPHGMLFLTVSALLAAGTLIGEGFAATGWLLPGQVRGSQVVALAILVIIVRIWPEIFLQHNYR
ncbi:prolipoprotein diacylglyceryl transferase [uncultured Chloroflexus sp.]|uniref:prolipoprotein diacylglyceryl transferase n=1 Tax=uncultured Chloroflexus sp. TaxID=214040 RepID=UPI002615E496|nr:prolipoprotein diacylglyceryl transferase family protein [uncultured Chloroflexus sp.]